MTEELPPGAPSPGRDGERRVARLWAGTPGTPAARAVGHLVTRECTHWDTVGPHAFLQHVNPEPRLQWRARFDAAVREDVYSDDPGAPALDLAATTVPLGGDELHVEWLDGPEADDAWGRHGW